MAKYSRRQLKHFLRTRTAPHDAPKYIFQELEKMRRKMNKEEPSMHQLMDNFMLEEMKLKRARPFIPAKSLKGRIIAGLTKSRSPGWMIKFREFLLDIFWDD